MDFEHLIKVLKTEDAYCSLEEFLERSPAPEPTPAEKGYATAYLFRWRTYADHRLSYPVYSFDQEGRLCAISWGAIFPSEDHATRALEKLVKFCKRHIGQVHSKRSTLRWWQERILEDRTWRQMPYGQMRLQMIRESKDDQRRTITVTRLIDPPDRTHANLSDLFA